VVTKRLILLVFAIATAFSVIAWISATFRHLPRLAVTEMPQGVFYSSGEQWFEFYRTRVPEGTGWVHLPEPTRLENFRSADDPFLKGFVRPHICGECHESQYEGLLETAHFRTAAPATRETVLGDFTAGQNRLATQDPHLHFEMLADEHELTQRVVVEQAGKQYEHRRSFDIVTGSGNHGQTYLYWEGDRLYQLPVSYFTEKGWINSPGTYRDGTADFARGVGDSCLFCHVTYAASDPNEFQRLDSDSLIFGVTCVRCHGPGWAHVQYHRTNPEADEARYIVNPDNLSRERANETCGQCHSGVGQLLQPAFSYRPGEPLDEFLDIDKRPDNPSNDDPHAANQLLRLVRSRCFQESEMTCASCHDPHQDERGKLKVFAARCASCHEQDACRLSSQYGNQIRHRCVQCHMPSRRDAEVTLDTSSGVLLPLLRDHLIQVWADVTERVVAEMEAETR
jgi:Cytochrome c554 and c-prime